MFVPATFKRLAMVVTALLASITMLVGCSSSSEVPKTSIPATSQSDLDEYSEQSSRGFSLYDRKNPNQNPIGLREWTTPNGKRCWDHDEEDTGTWGGKSLWGPAIEDYNGPVDPNAPVITVSEFVDKLRELADTCRDDYVNTRDHDMNWVIDNVCENFPSGDLILRSFLVGIRYFDGTDFSAVQCPDNLGGDASLRVVVPRDE